MKNIIILIFLAGMLFGNSVRTDHVTAELVPEFVAIQPGIPFTVALRLKMDEHWHTYWRNPGDSGIPTKIKWNLPEGFTAEEINWPHPKKIVVSGLSNFAFEDEVFLLTEITPPAEISRENITIQAKADWLVCKVECLPGGAELSLTLPVGKNPAPHPKWAASINETRASLPISNAPWEVNAQIDQNKVIFTLTPISDAITLPDEVTFFPYREGLFDNAAEQILSRTDNSLILELALESFRTTEPDTLTGIFVSDTGWRGEGSEKAMEFTVIPGEDVTTGSTEADSQSLLLILGFAFLGGLILNLMPCVLPVLSLKIMGFVQQANSGKKEIYHHGLSFTAGVLVSFWALAGILLLLQSGGQKLGWGFQLQEPIFLLILIVLLFLFALNLFGVFEIGSSLTQLGGAGAKTGGLTGSFISGITATIVATPCTAPFMGTALGYTLTQSSFVTMTVFTFLAIGMAFPYLLLSIFPQWLKLVPKPGNWMISFKQFMGFLLAATVIWLLWVLAAIKGSDAVILTMLILLFGSVAAWIYGRWGNISVSGIKRKVAIVAAILTLILPAYYFGKQIDNGEFNSSNSLSHDQNWENFDQSKINSYISEGKPVFIDFTATWCLTCQVNKKVALHEKSVYEAFEDKGVVTVIADWTKRDDTITDALASFGRNSVPLYVLYTGKKGEEPFILPEVLTPKIVKEYINKL